ncbi:hypothetical protein Tco_1372870 [Tanacetum coccineum]
MTGILRTIMVEGKPFNTEHKLNKYNHVKPIKQNKRGLGPDHNMAACKETEELMNEGILWKVKHQTWVANPVMVSIDQHEASINDLRTSHKGSASRSFEQKVNRGKRCFEGRYAGEEKLDGPYP